MRVGTGPIKRLGRRTSIFKNILQGHYGSYDGQCLEFMEMSSTTKLLGYGRDPHRKSSEKRIEEYIMDSISFINYSSSNLTIGMDQISSSITPTLFNLSLTN